MNALLGQPEFSQRGEAAAKDRGREISLFLSALLTGP